MMSDYIQLCDRNFVVGYLTPAILFVTISALLFANFIPNEAWSDSISTIASQNVSSNLSYTILIDINQLLIEIQKVWTNFAIILLFLIWLLSILLMAANQEMIRIMEGYVILQKIPLLRTRKLDQFNKRKNEIADIKKIFEDEKLKKGEPSSETANLYIDYNE